MSLGDTSLLWECWVQAAMGLSGSDGKPILLWECWVQAAMGLKSSPYQTVQGMLVVKEVILGDRLDKNFVFCWDKIRINLPGSKTYVSSLPWVSKVHLNDGRIAADLFIYVDDLNQAWISLSHTVYFAHCKEVPPRRQSSIESMQAVAAVASEDQANITQSIKKQ
jgi:hypothetical protein